jgi:hypothetical protein
MAAARAAADAVGSKLAAGETAKFGLPDAGWPERTMRTPVQPLRELL